MDRSYIRAGSQITMQTADSAVGRVVGKIWERTPDVKFLVSRTESTGRVC
jgi:hypothetical protein